jgi:hypothetical protein
MEKVNCTDRVKNKEILHSVKEYSYIVASMAGELTELATCCVGTD